MHHVAPISSRELVINDEIEPLDELIAADKHDRRRSFMGQFWPALRQRRDRRPGLRRAVPELDAAALLQRRHVQGRRPRSRQAAADLGRTGSTPPKKLTKRDGDRVTRWGLMLPANYDYCGWITRGLAMSNGGQYYNPDYGGEVYYDRPTMLGAVHLLDRPGPQVQGACPRA